MDNNVIWVIGTGPGSKEYLTYATVDKIAEQDILAGSQKTLSLFSDLNKETYVFEKDVEALVSFLKDNYQKKNIAVLVTGDTGIYSLAGSLKKHFETGILRFLPGISSVQLFFAKIGISYEDVKIESVHGKPMSGLAGKIKEHKKICILTDNVNSPRKIAEILLAQNLTAKAWVGQNISLSNEMIVQKDLYELSNDGDYPNSLIYLELEENK